MPAQRLREGLAPSTGLTLGLVLWLAAVLLWQALIALFLPGQASEAGPEAAEVAAWQLMIASPILVPLVIAWVVCTLRNWRWGIVGLPPALLFLFLYGSWLYLFLTELIFA